MLRNRSNVGPSSDRGPDPVVRAVERPDARAALLDNLASRYSEACTEVNQRLGNCQRLLQQGLRSEAIQLADSEPKLLDASTAVDFPERSTWDELVATLWACLRPQASSRGSGAIESGLRRARAATGSVAHPSPFGLAAIAGALRESA